jgi:hypothetical protein
MTQQITERELQLIVFSLAHQNDMTINEFLEHLTTQYTVDTSHLPKDKDGCTKLEDGNLGIDLDLNDEEALTIHWSAAREGITTNQYIVKALELAIEQQGLTPPKRKTKKKKK